MNLQGEYNPIEFSNVQVKKENLKYSDERIDFKQHRERNKYHHSRERSYSENKYYRHQGRYKHDYDQSNFSHEHSKDPYHRPYDMYYKRNKYDRSRSPSPDQLTKLTYDPVKAGSMTGEDDKPHDKGIKRAMLAKYNPESDKKIIGDPHKTLFIGRLNRNTNEETLRNTFSKYGDIAHLRIVRDIATGTSKGYAFITFENKDDFKYAYKKSNGIIVDDHKLLVEVERERISDGWIPRRLGGGLGGRKESGQLRFGGRDRPHRRPQYRRDYK